MTKSQTLSQEEQGSKNATPEDSNKGRQGALYSEKADRAEMTLERARLNAVAVFSLLFVSLLWGSSFLFIKMAAQAFDPLGIAAGRVLVAAAFLLAVGLATRTMWPRGTATLAKLVLLSLVGQILPFVMLGLSGHLTTSADMALMMGAAPLVTFVLGRFVPPAEAWSGRVVLGLGLGLLGVAIALSPPVGLGAGTPAEWLGRLCAFLAAIGYAAGALVSRNLSRTTGTTAIVTTSMIVSAVLLSTAWFATHATPSWTAVVAIPAAPVVALLVLGLVNTALAYIVYFRLIGTAGATFASLNNYLVPVVGLILGVIALGERVEQSALIGLVLILGGIVLAGMRPRSASWSNRSAAT